MSSRTRMLLVTGCFFLAGLFAPPPLLRLGAASPRPAGGATAAVADRSESAVQVPGGLAPAVLGGPSYARR